MLQREVAERIVASPGEKEYGPLSVFIQIFSDVSIRFLIKPSAFFPPPKVESAVVQMVWKDKPLIELKNEEWFKKVVKASFGYRRKTLINALKHSELSLPESIKMKMDKLGIDPQRRPGTLTLLDFIRLADALK
jgi:16S rRNA (adenine1518-N6/adenine1519-N6)-dimethyltransferase